MQKYLENKLPTRSTPNHQHLTISLKIILSLYDVIFWQMTQKVNLKKLALSHEFSSAVHSYRAQFYA